MCSLIDNLPNHVAIIPDGTRRWARKRGLPEIEGAKAGAETIHKTIAYLLDSGIKYLTVWGFSTDNWKRSEDQIGFLFEQVQIWLERDAPWLHSQGVRFRHIGRLDRLPSGLQRGISYWGELTRQNVGMTLIAAFDYSGRAEIVDAVRRLIDSGRLGEPAMSRPQLDEKLFSRYLYTDGMPDVDLVIRTSGELRLSNFMLWQAAYSEFYFTDLLWPDFDTKELEKALQVYSERKRRFGGD
ncbi:Ditrans,polycis-undecaprenyl-diphosphate synthase ((2E,6E)-farnesyl-diphosphate specific) [subsurface metagenome]